MIRYFENTWLKIKFKALNVNVLNLVLVWVLTLLLSPISLVNAQETTRLLLMNGKYLDVIDFDDSTRTDLVYKYDRNFYKRQRSSLKAARKSGQSFHPDSIVTSYQKFSAIWTQGAVDRMEVFSAKPNSSPEKVFYYYDEPAGNYLTEAEMRAFVIGERDARFGVRGKGWFYGGLVLGFGAGYALQGSIFTIAVPPVLALGAKIPIVKIKHEHVLDARYHGDPNYAAGYESVARSRYFLETLKGSALGAFLGLAVYSIVQANN